MENNNGRGIFYGVIGVATLIVAIIGATFAYFSAQTNTAPNAITASSAIIQLQIATDETNTNLGANMIPVETDGTTAKTDEDSVNLATTYKGLFPKFPSAGSANGGDEGREACEDLLGNRICSIYTFTITNPSTASQKIYGFLTVESNTFSNLKYAVFKGTPGDVAATMTAFTAGAPAADTGWDVNGKDGDKLIDDPDNDGNYTTISNGEIVKATTDVPKTAVTTASTADPLSYIPGMTVTLGPTGSGTASVTYTVLLWIEETGADQTSGDSFEDAGVPKAFAGGILVNTSGGGDGVTASLQLAA